MRKFLMVEIVNKNTGVIKDLQVCLSQQEVNEIKVDFRHEKFIIPCDKKTAIKSLKSFRKTLDK